MPHNNAFRTMQHMRQMLESGAAMSAYQYEVCLVCPWRHKGMPGSLGLSRCRTPSLRSRCVVVWSQCGLREGTLRRNPTQSTRGLCGVLVFVFHRPTGTACLVHPTSGWTSTSLEELARGYRQATVCKSHAWDEGLTPRLYANLVVSAHHTRTMSLLPSTSSNWLWSPVALPPSHVRWSAAV